MLSAPEDCSSGEEKTLQKALEQILDEYEFESREITWNWTQIDSLDFFQQSSKSVVSAYVRSHPIFESSSFSIKIVRDLPSQDYLGAC